jgi:alpha-L-fucosidase
MKVNGKAIYGTTASPFPTLLPWGRCTKKVENGETTLYLHVFTHYWPKDGQLMIPELRNPDVKASLLKRNWLGFHKKLKVVSDANGLTISLPKNAQDKYSTTIVLKLKEAPKIMSAKSSNLSVN